MPTRRKRAAWRTAGARRAPAVLVVYEPTLGAQPLDDGTEHLVRHAPELSQGLVAVVADVEVDLRHALRPTEHVAHVQQHCGLHGVAGRERNAIEELPARSHLAGERLRELGEVGEEGRQERPGGELGDAPALVRALLAVRRGEGPPELALHEADLLLADQRAQQPSGEVSGEVARVGVEIDDELARATASARHMASPLPSTGPNSGSSSDSWCTSAPCVGGDLRGPVLRRRIDHEDLVDQRGPATGAARRSARSCPPPRAPAVRP